MEYFTFADVPNKVIHDLSRILDKLCTHYGLQLFMLEALNVTLSWGFDEFHSIAFEDQL